MAAERSGGYGSCDELSGENARPRSMPWFPTHRIVYRAGPQESRTIEVMAWDRGAEARGPARYALYTVENVDTESAPEWAMDGEGRVYLRGAPVSGDATAVVEETWG